MEEKKEEDMDVAEDLYVASDLYEEDDVETGIRLGASPTRDGAPSPPRVQAMEVDSGVHEDAIMDCSMTRFQPLGVRMVSRSAKRVSSSSS